MRIAPALLLVALATACGSSHASPPTERAPALAKNGPPPAWLETKAGRTWLGFSSSCWRHGNTGICADAVAPRCSYKSVPPVTVEPGETVRAHLGYSADEASVDNAQATLEGRIVSWRVEEPGPFVLFTKGKPGDASYVACARLTG